MAENLYNQVYQFYDGHIRMETFSLNTPFDVFKTIVHLVRLQPYEQVWDIGFGIPCILATSSFLTGVISFGNELRNVYKDILACSAVYILDKTEKMITDVQMSLLEKKIDLCSYLQYCQTVTQSSEDFIEFLRNTAYRKSFLYSPKTQLQINNKMFDCEDGGPIYLERDKFNGACLDDFSNLDGHETEEKVVHFCLTDFMTHIYVTDRNVTEFVTDHLGANINIVFIFAEWFPESSDRVAVVKKLRETYSSLDSVVYIGEKRNRDLENNIASEKSQYGGGEWIMKTHRTEYMQVKK